VKACLVVFLFAAAASAQETIRVDVGLVNLLCTVRDKSGAIVNDLTREEFAVSEDGHPQRISHFARQTDLPLSVALVLDASWSTRGVFADETEAARRFFHDVLRPTDNALIAGFAAGVAVWQEPTSSLQALDSTLDRTGQLAPSLAAKVPRHNGPGPIMIKIHGDGGSRIYDAVDLVSRERLKRLPGRKAMVLISDGDDSGSVKTLKEAAQAAQQSDVIVYGIHYDGFAPVGLQMLKDLSGPTGGRTFHVDKKTSLDDVFAAIANEMRNQYAIGYPALSAAENSGFHKIEVRVTRPGLVVRTRNGYYR
jgi:VWFA-related protein